MTNEEKAKIIADAWRPCSEDFYSGMYTAVKLNFDAEGMVRAKSKQNMEINSKDN